MQQFKLKWKPIEKLPWVIDEGFDEDSDRRYLMPIGIALLRNDGYITVVGSNIAGSRTQGCDCCSTPWKEKISEYTGWCWVLPQSVRCAVVEARAKWLASQ